ncbi:4-O-methyl-glucuronoyl methylesterase 1-like [Vigna angularis]|uniref:4-O-methyl-glucuronoyl methylesterase 1-like n=1 Tax=Phaseolus angularis TaxID=3914 RepID=UPI0022B4326F|nr:4-O-methyl-glucuronoyl methylesterase 1-like [Vigna angularis]
MTREGSERHDKGKGVARPKNRQRHAPKYVLRVPATLPITAALSPSSMGPSPTPTVHPPPTLATNILPPPVIITPTPPPVSITPTPPPTIITLTPPSVNITSIAPPNPTSIPFSSFIPPSETATPSADPDLADDEFRNKCATAQRNRASEKSGTLHTGGSITVHEHGFCMWRELEEYKTQEIVAIERRLKTRE